jgi:AhpD family alkylhydroperoxidase
MEPRINYRKISPDAFRAMLGLEKFVRESGIEKSPLELVKIRASQINGCAYCLDMHTKDARAAGETEQRIYTLSAWRETPFFSEREQAALLWAETLTRLSQNDVPDEIFDNSVKRRWCNCRWRSWRSTGGTASASVFDPFRGRISRAGEATKSPHPKPLSRTARERGFNARLWPRCVIGQ